MASDVARVALGDVTDMLSGATPSKAQPDYWGGDIPWVSAKDMKEPRLGDAKDHITPAGLANGSKLAPAGATLVLTRGMTLLTDVPICRLGRDVAFNQDLKAIVPRDAIDPSYLTYALLAAKPDLLSMVELAGHGTGRLPTDRLKALEIPLPEKREQRAIAHILGSLDDKIELNRRMNETLEAMARAIFKSWFVDATQAGLPEGWREGKVEELLTLSRETITPSDFPHEAFDHYSIPSFDEGRLPKVETGEQIQSNKFLVPPGAVMISKLNPRIPRVWLPNVSAQHRSVASTEFLVAIPKAGISREWLYALFSSQAFLDVFATLVTGTSGSHQRVKPEYLLAIDLEIPPKERIAEYTALAKPLREHFALNLEESGTLAALRDALLPKLISGELRIKDAERVVRGVT